MDQTKESGKNVVCDEQGNVNVVPGEQSGMGPVATAVVEGVVGNVSENLQGNEWGEVNESLDWFDNATWMEQVRMFFKSLSDSISLSENEDFRIMNVNLSWNPIQFLRAKEWVSTDHYKGHKPDLSKLDYYDKKAAELWCDPAFKKDIIELHKQMLVLFNKLWKPEKLNEEDPFTFIARFLECGFTVDHFLLRDKVDTEGDIAEDKEDFSYCLLSRFWNEFKDLKESGKAYTCWTWEPEHPLYLRMKR